MHRVYVLFCFLALVSCGTDSGSLAPVRQPQVYHKVAGPDLVDSRDGKTYPTVVVGHQVWMARNLSLDTFDGSWSRCQGTNGSPCASGARLYTWALAMADTTLAAFNQCSVSPDKRGICPTNWHVPDSTEWATLATSLGGWESAGRILKSTGGWAVRPDGFPGSDSDRVGFAAEPFGFWTQGAQDYGWYGHTPADSAYQGAGYRAAFWTRSNSVYNSCWSAWGVFLSNEDHGLRLLTVPRLTALNVRCVRDRDTTNAM